MALRHSTRSVDHLLQLGIRVLLTHEQIIVACSRPPRRGAAVRGRGVGGVPADATPEREQESHAEEGI